MLSCWAARAALLTSGVPVHIAAARLGDNPNTLLSTYAHLLPSSDDDRRRAGGGGDRLVTVS
jgi:hypothetical protein